MELQLEDAGRRSQVSQLQIGSGTGRVDENGITTGTSLQNFQPLRA
jgi:hypothetical protein